MNFTLKRVLFWMVLVVVGVVVWKFSTTFQTHERLVAFSDFMADVDSGKVEKVTITGHEIAGIYRTDKEGFSTYAPSQYDGLANQLIERGTLVTAKEPTQTFPKFPVFAMIRFALGAGAVPETGTVCGPAGSSL